MAETRNPQVNGNVDAEYNILRAEILQYMEEYQTLRNMMYVGTVGLLSINTVSDYSVYLYLLPLAIILPSYVLFYDYWKSVSIASIYMQVFLEREPEEENASLHMWETRHREFGEFLERTDTGRTGKCKAWVRRRQGFRWSGMSCHHIPYFVCAILCFALYGVAVFTSGQEGLTLYLSIALAVMLALISIVVFVRFRKPDLTVIEQVWKALRDGEAPKPDKQDGALMR